MKLLTINLSVLSSTKVWYLNPGLICKITGAYTALNTALTTADSTITISDGTTDVGEITITYASNAVGDCDALTFDTTSKGDVEFSKTTPIKIACDSAPGAGAAMLTLVIDEYATNKA